MASSGWQGRRLISNWGSYSQMYADVNIQSLTRNANSVSVSGQVALIYVNTAGGTGSYGYVVSGAVQGGNTVSFSTWSSQRSEYTQYRDFSATISAAPTATSAGLRIIFSSGGGLSYGDQTWTLSFNQSATNPSGLSVSIISVADTSATFNVNLTSYGTPSSADGRYIEAAILGGSSYGNPYRYAIARNTRTSNITVSTSSSTGSTPLTVTPNTRYHYGGYASNTVRNISVVSGEFTTRPAYISNVVATDAGHGTFVINVVHANEGTAETVRTEYSYDQETWEQASDTFQLQVSGPTTIYVRRTNSTGSTPVKSLSMVPYTAVKLYGSVNGVAEEIKKLYFGAKSLSTASAPTPMGLFNALREDFVEKMNDELANEFTQGYSMDSVFVERVAEFDEWRIGATLRKAGAEPLTKFLQGNIAKENLPYAFEGWGMEYRDVEWGSDISTLPIAGTYTTASKKIKKLYGSVGGESKLIFEDLT